jgi:hypothetical protein
MARMGKSRLGAAIGEFIKSGATSTDDPVYLDRLAKIRGTGGAKPAPESPTFVIKDEIENAFKPTTSVLVSKKSALAFRRYTNDLVSSNVVKRRFDYSYITDSIYETREYDREGYETVVFRACDIADDTWEETIFEFKKSYTARQEKARDHTDIVYVPKGAIFSGKFSEWLVIQLTHDYELADKPVHPNAGDW